MQQVHRKIIPSKGFISFPLIILVKTPLLFYISRSTSLHSCFLHLPFSPLLASPTLFPRWSALHSVPSGQAHRDSIPRVTLTWTVRTMPPSCQLPSASIPTSERRKRGGRVRARGWDSRKDEKRVEREGKNRKTNHIFSFLGGRKRKESMWIWVSHY